jgi:hypothetical protein
MCIENDLFSSVEESWTQTKLISNIIGYIDNFNDIKILEVNINDVYLFDRCNDLNDVIPIIKRNNRNNIINAIL